MTKTRFYLFSLMVVSSFFAIGQTKKTVDPFLVRLENSDSIKIISHKITEGYVVTEDTRIEGEIKAKTQSPPVDENGELILPLLKKGKINPVIIIESLSLNETNTFRLINILKRKVQVKKLTFSTCDQPQHLIIIYKKNQQSYIDICFGCRRIHTSKDINFSEFNLDFKKWEDLKQFFKTNGLTKVFEQYNE